MTASQQLGIERAHRTQRCAHIHLSGRPCGSPALSGRRLCYFHDRARRPQRPNYDLPLLEDATSIQFALTQVVRALQDKALDTKTCGPAALRPADRQRQPQAPGRGARPRRRGRFCRARPFPRANASPRTRPRSRFPRQRPTTNDQRLSRPRPVPTRFTGRLAWAYTAGFRNRVRRHLCCGSEF